MLVLDVKMLNNRIATGSANSRTGHLTCPLMSLRDRHGKLRVRVLSPGPAGLFSFYCMCDSP